MSFIKRARLYVIRHKLKSLILFMVLIIISTFMLTGFAIEQAITNTATDVRTSVGGKITLDLGMDNEENLELVDDDEGHKSYEFIGDWVTEDTLRAILEVPGVMDYNIEGHAFWAAAVNFDLLPPDFGSGDYEDTYMLTTMSSEKFSGFANGNLRLEAGRHLTEDDHYTILISDELAEHNNLKVGDTLEWYIDDEIPSTKLELEIIGIFSGTRGVSGETYVTSDVAGNQVIIDLATTLKIHQEYRELNPEYQESDPESSTVDLPGPLTIYVEDPIRIQNVYDEIARLPEVNGKTFVLNMGTEDFDIIADPLESLQGLVYTLILTIFAVSLVILALLLTIWTRGRIKEIGILLSNGITKLEIISQFLLEVVVIAVVAFTLSYPISQVVANGAGKFVMTQFTDVQNLINDDLKDGMVSEDVVFNRLSGSLSFENITDHIDITVSLNHLIWVYVMGLPVAMGSVLIASYTVVKLKPKEILSKMS